MKELENIKKSLQNYTGERYLYLMESGSVYFDVVKNDILEKSKQYIYKLDTYDISKIKNGMSVIEKIKWCLEYAMISYILRKDK